MMTSEFRRRLIFSPTPYIMLYIFLSVTTLHLMVPVLESLPVELVLIGLIILLSLADIPFSWSKDRDLARALIAATYLASSLILAPVFSSFFNEEYLSVFLNQEYRSFSKNLIILPLIIFYIPQYLKRDQFINFLMVCMSGFALIFFYRYLVLGEVRDFDLRPLLNIRHGDPNFIGTFFNVMVPFCVYELLKSRSGLRGFVYVLLLMMFSTVILFTKSRMAIMVLLLSLVTSGFFFARRPGNRGLPDFVFIAGICLPFLFLKPFLARFQNVVDISNIDRLASFYSGAIAFFHSPWFGVGWNHSSQYYHSGRVTLFETETPVLEVHNTFLKVLSELGFFGFIPFAMVIFLTYRVIGRNLSVDRDMSICSLMAITGILMNSLTIAAFYKDLYLLFLVSILIMNLYKPDKTIQR